MTNYERIKKCENCNEAASLLSDFLIANFDDMIDHDDNCFSYHSLVLQWLRRDSMESNVVLKWEKVKGKSEDNINLVKGIFALGTFAGLLTWIWFGMIGLKISGSCFIIFMILCAVTKKDDENG